MASKNIIGDFLRTQMIEYYGICSFSDCLPLIDCRAKLRLPHAARSVIVCLFPYYIGDFPRRNVARYAVSNDYHNIVGGILQSLADFLEALYPNEKFVPFVDNSPIREVYAASLAGLGVIGNHGLLINPRYGSMIFIGSVVTTLSLPPNNPSEAHCLRCGKCSSACPTGALISPNTFYRDLCRSHITQKKGALTTSEISQISRGKLVWGCDICTDVCPMNTREFSPIKAFYENTSEILTEQNLGDLMRNKAYGYRGRQILMRNLSLL